MNRSTLQRKPVRSFDRIATECIAFVLSIAGIYVALLIGEAVWYVAFTPAGHALTGSR